MADALVSMREGPNTTQRSHTLDTIPETQDLNLDLEVVLPNVSVGVGHLPYEEIVDPNATILCPYTPRLGLIRLSLEFRQLEPNIFHLYWVYLHRLFLEGITHKHNPTLYNSITLRVALTLMMMCRLTAVNT